MTIFEFERLGFSLIRCAIYCAEIGALIVGVHILLENWIAVSAMVFMSSTIFMALGVLVLAIFFILKALMPYLSSTPPL